MKKQTKIAKSLSNIFVFKPRMIGEVLMLCLSLVLILSVSFAWFSGREFLFNTTYKDPMARLATLENKVDVIGYALDEEETSITITEFKKNKEDVSNDRFIDADSFTPGALNSALSTSAANAIIEANTNTKYIKVTNRSDMDIAVKTEFSILNPEKYNLTAFWYLITDVTTDITSTNITGYSGSLETTEEKKIYTYAANNKSSRTANTYNENNVNVRTFDNLTGRVTLGQINEPDNHDVGNTRYYRLDYGLSELALRSSGAEYFNESVKVDVYVYYGQVNAPDDESDTPYNNIKEVYTAEEFQNILQNVNLAYHGDTIKLMADMEIDPLGTRDYVELTRPLNIDLDKYKLTINGDFNIEYASTTNIKIDISDLGQLFVKGDLNITTPNAEVDIVGANQKQAGQSACDLLLYGVINNGVGIGSIGETKDGGLTLDNTYIVCKEYYEATSSYIDTIEVVKMLASSKLTVTSGVTLDEVYSGETTGVHINNYGSIGWIHLESMVLPNTQSLQIYVYNNGELRGETYSGATRIDHSSGAITLPISSTVANTKIVMGKYSNTFYVDGSTLFTNADITHEGVETQYVTKIKNENNAYKIYLDGSVTKTNNSRLRKVIEDYFTYNGEINDESIKAIEKLVIESTTDVYIDENDFAYLKSTVFRDLNYLDMADTRVYTSNYGTGQQVSQRYNRIPNNALEGKSSLTTVILPKTVKYIGTKAFFDTGIRAITIPTSVETVGTQAFNTVSEVTINGLYPLTNANFLPAFGNEVYYLVDETVVDTFKTRFASYGSTGKDIANHVYCFSFLYEGRYIRLLNDGTIEIVAYTGDINGNDIAPNSIEYLGNTTRVSSIGRDAYINTKNESGLTLSLILKEGIEKIGKNAFENLTFLQSVTLQNNTDRYTTTIDSYAFANCGALRTVNIGGKANINSYAFYNCSAIETLNMEGALSIADNAFYKCSSITNLFVPNVTYIGPSAFSGCTSFQNIVLGKITSIGSNAFKNCTFLETVGLTNTTTDIGDSAFAGCSKLKTIYTYNADSALVERMDGYAYLQYVKNVFPNAFSGCTSLQYVVFDNVERIDANAFNKCSAIEYVEANTVTTIGNSAFENCTNLAQIEMGSVNTIGAKAFYNLKKLEYVIVPNATTIGSQAFEGCSAVAAISLGNFTAGYSAFSKVYPDYVDLSSYSYPDTLTGTITDSLGNSISWHYFNSSTKFYFAPGSSDSETALRRNYIYKVICNSYEEGYSDSLLYNYVFSLKTIMGNNIIQSEDYVTSGSLNGLGSRNYIGVTRNLGLYNVDVDSQTIISYHGPDLVGYNVLPFNDYSDEGISEEDFNNVLNGVSGSENAGTISDGTISIQIKKIGDYAFYGVGGSMNNEDYCNVVFAPSVIEIGTAAFQKSGIQFLYCNKVKEIKLNAFRGNTELRFVDLGDTTTIGLYAFAALNPSSVTDGSDIADYYYRYGNLSFTSSKLTKVIFRHVNTLGDGAFVRNTYALTIYDFTNNIPVENSTTGFGPNHNINIPTNFTVTWNGYGVGTNYNNNRGYHYRDSYVLAPYYYNQMSEISGRFQTFVRSDQTLFDYGYWYNPDYEVNGVKVGMYLLKPPDAGTIDQGLYLYKSFVRNIGENDVFCEGISQVEGSTKRLLYTIPGRLEAGPNKLVSTNGTALTKAYYQLKLSSSSFKYTTVDKKYTCDISFGDELTDIPTYCFYCSNISNVYLNNVETINSYAFYYDDIGTIYGYHLKTIAPYISYDGYIKIIDLRQNVYKEGEEKAGEPLVTSFDPSFMSYSSVNAIYVTEDAYDEYVEGTKNIVISHNYNNEIDTDLELYLYVTVPGMYVGNLNLLNTATYDLSGLIAPYTYAANQTIEWETSDADTILVDDGIVSVASYVGRTLSTGSADVYCYRKTDNSGTITKELLCKFKVTINTTSTSYNYYNLLVSNSGDIKVVKSNGALDISSGVFDPSTYLTEYMDQIITSTDISTYNLHLVKRGSKYEITEVGIASYYGTNIAPDAFVYLVTDNYLDKINDYAFFHVAFYEVWLPYVTEIGRKAFLNGAAQNNLVTVVMPRIQTIGYMAFAQNRNVETVVVGQNAGNASYYYDSNLTTIGDYAFYANNSLRKFGTVTNNINALTKEEIYTHNYTFTFTKDRVREEVYNEEYGYYIYEYQYTFYTAADDLFIYIPDTVESLGAYAFYQCILSQELRLPRNYNCNRIGSYCFGLCKALNLIKTNEYITTVGSYAFYGCESLTEYTEDDDGNQLTGISFEYFTKIESCGFRQCYNLREVHFGAIKEIGNQAFYNCDKLRFIYFEEQWVDDDVKFGTNWNAGCHQLLRNYVTYDNQIYFKGANNIYVKEAIGYREDDTDQEYEYVVNYIRDINDNVTGVSIACYNGIIEDVADDNVLENIPAFLVVEGVRQPVLGIGAYAYKGFNARAGVDTIILPSSVSTVGNYAFYNCDFEEYVEELADLSSINEVSYGNGVFSNNELLVSAEFRRMASGGSGFFRSSPNFTTMVLTNNVNQYGVYTAPVIADDFFSGARSDAKCLIAANSIDLFGAVGYIGRVFESGSTSIDGKYELKLVDDHGVTKYQIIRYNPTSIEEDYTVPSTIDGVEVMSIGMSAYTNITVLPGTTLTIPAGIKFIDTYAFYKTAFTNVVIQSPNVTFGDEVFAENSSLKTLNISAVQELTGTGLFKNDIMLYSVNLNSTNEIIPEYYFYGCTNLLTIDIKGTTEIKDYAFASCTALNTMYSSNTAIPLTNGTVDVGLVTKIGKYAFANDASITRIDLRMTSSIGEYAFRNCTGLQSSATILSSAVLGVGIFYGCSNLTTFIATFDAIPNYCFYGCTNLASITLAGVTSIGDYAFYNNSKLTSIAMPNVLTIGHYAFENCKKLASVDMGRVNTIGNRAFYNCKLITSIDFKLVESVGNYSFYNCGLTGTLDLKNVKMIGYNAFDSNIALTEVIFSRVTSISSNVFYSDVNINYLYFDDNGVMNDGNLVKQAPTYAASNCFNGLNTSYLIYFKPDSEADYDTLYADYVYKFANYKSHIFEHGQFSNTDSNYMVKTKDNGTIEIIRYFGETLPANYNIPQILDGKTVTSIGNYAYTHLKNNPNLVTSTLNLGINVTKVGNYAFADLDFDTISLTSVEYIGAHAFENNETLTYLSLPQCISVGDYAFNNNNSLQIVRFGSMINKIGNNAFDNSEDLRNVYFASDDASAINAITYNNSGYVFGALSTSEVKIRVPSGSLNTYKNKFSYYSSRISVGQIDDADFSYRVSSDGIEIISYEGQAASVVIPNQINHMNVVKILDEAFVNSLNLQSVTLPSTLTSISSHAFLNNNSIRNIYVSSGTNNKFVVVDNVLYMRESGVITTMVYHPVAYNQTSYSFASNAAYSLDNVTMIYENAFYGNPYLKHIVVPATVTHIGESAFASMPSIQTVTFANPTSGQAKVPYLYGTNIFDITVDDLIIYVPSSALVLYKNDEFFSYYKRFIQAL